MPPPPVLVLDLDGTLVDSAPDLLATLNVLLAAEKLEPLPPDTVRHLVGHGVRVLLERGFRASGVEPLPARMDELFPIFVDHYTEHIAELTRPFPGALEALDRFAAEGWQLAVCTNKLETLARRLLGELGIAERFATITGGDTFGIGKPDPRCLLGTIERAGGHAGTAVMVGDSATDIDAARAAGVPIVAVDFGYTPIPVTELGPDAVISDYAALWDAVARLRQVAV